MQESELEPEFVSLLEVLRRPDPAVEPGSQRRRSVDVPAKLVTGAYLNRLKMPMMPFSCHLKSARAVVFFVAVCGGRSARPWFDASGRG